MPFPSPEQQLDQLISGYWVSQAVYVAAKLKLADHLASGAGRCDELASLTQTNPAALFRVLRALASVGVFQEGLDGKFANTPLSEPLRCDVPGSKWAMTVMMGEEHYQAWGELLYSVQTGKGAFRKVYGQGVFDYLAKHSEQAQLFDAAMTSIHGREAEPMLDAFDLAGVSMLADIGGGNGTLLSTALRRYPNLKGLLFDLPHVVERARPKIEAAGLTSRCDLIGGDFFSAVPDGADVYLMRHIVHDWDDALSTKILRNCAARLKPNGKVLVVESVIPPGNDPHFGKWLDLTMLVIPEGKERTAAEYGALFAAAGLRLSRIVPTAGGVDIIEGVAA